MSEFIGVILQFAVCVFLCLYLFAKGDIAGDNRQIKESIVYNGLFIFSLICLLIVIASHLGH